MLVDIDIIMRVFIKKYTYQMSINRESDHNSKCSCKPCENSLFLSLSLSMKRFEQEIQKSGDCVDTARG